MREDIKINDRAAALSDQLVAVLESVYDPEIELDIYNLGLVYEINLDDQGFCTVVMTFTDAGCSCADTLPVDLVAALKTIGFLRRGNTSPRQSACDRLSGTMHIYNSLLIC